MTKHTPYRVPGLNLPPRSARRIFRSLALLMLLLGIVAWSARTDLGTQPPLSQEIKAPEAPKTDKVKENDQDKRPPFPTEASQFARPPAQATEPAPPQAIEVKGMPDRSSGPVPSFQFTIDPKTPLKDLLPAPPKKQRVAGPLLGNDLSRVPEVQFVAALGGDGDAMRKIAHQIAKINHLNHKNADGFMEALRGERPDLSGLPFAMGDACRTKGERSKQFAAAVATVRQAMQMPTSSSGPGSAGTCLECIPWAVALSRRAGAAFVPHRHPRLLPSRPMLIRHHPICSGSSINPSVLSKTNPKPNSGARSATP